MKLVSMLDLDGADKCRDGKGHRTVGRDERRFSTLLISAVPAVRDFGVLLAIGVVVLSLAGLFILNATLYRFARHQPKELAEPNPGPALGQRRLRFDHIMPTIVRSARRHPIWIVVPAVLLAAGGFVADTSLNVQTDIEELIPADTPGVIPLQDARRVVGATVELPFLVAAADVTQPEITQWIAEFQHEALAGHPELLGVDSVATVLELEPGDPAPTSQTVANTLRQMPADIRSGLITNDQQSAAIVFAVDDITVAELNDLIDDLVAEAEPPAQVTVTPGGTWTLTARSVSATTEHRGLILAAGIGAVFIGLLAIYRNWRRTLTAVAPIVLVIGWSSALMWLLDFELNPLTAVLGVLIIGIGTEYTVLLLERYWEERGRGADPDAAIVEAAARIGRAITVSGATTAAGFGALIASSFPALRDFGILTVANVIAALIATLIIVPALLHWLDPPTRSKPDPRRTMAPAEPETATFGL